MWLGSFSFLIPLSLAHSINLLKARNSHLLIHICWWFFLLKCFWCGNILGIFYLFLEKVSNLIFMSIKMLSLFWIFFMLLVPCFPPWVVWFHMFSLMYLISAFAFHLLQWYLSIQNVTSFCFFTEEHFTHHCYYFLRKNYEE